ncbi:MAG TPA: hypothetical protein PKH95_03755 [Candidatus Magasanikbacteria bacterium]|nr:hypothetical protein [Candidatus Magasanikbacteria bacterium]
MNLTLRARIFIIISLVVLLILAISLTIVVISGKNKKQEQQNEANNQEVNQEQSFFNEQIPVTTPTIIPSGAVVKEMTSEEKMKTAVINMAKVFIERYGSYSTDNPGQNLKDLEVLCTPDLWKVLENRIVNMKTENEFLGMITRAFSVSLVSFENDKATVSIITAREENKNGLIKNYNQEVEVFLLKINDNWLVDNVKWK